MWRGTPQQEIGSQGEEGPACYFLQLFAYKSLFSSKLIHPGASFVTFCYPGLCPEPKRSAKPRVVSNIW